MKDAVWQALRELWKAPEADPSEVARGKRIAVRAVWAAEHGGYAGPPCERCWHPEDSMNHRRYGFCADNGGGYKPVKGW